MLLDSGLLSWATLCRGLRPGVQGLTVWAIVLFTSSRTRFALLKSVGSLYNRRRGSPENSAHEQRPPLFYNAGKINVYSLRSLRTIFRKWLKAVSLNNHSSAFEPVCLCSCILHPCYLLPNFHSCIFHTCIFDRIAFSTRAFSVA